MTGINGAVLIERGGVHLAKDLRLLQRGHGRRGGIEPAKQYQHAAILRAVTNADRRQTPVGKTMRVDGHGATAGRRHAGRQVRGLLRRL